MAKLLGLDIGTSGVKALLVDERGAVLRSAHAEVPLSTPKPGWSEQDPANWWKATESCIEQIGATPDAVGLSGQMHGSTFLDADGKVIRPALLWNDQRTSEQVSAIDRTVGYDRIREITANPPLTGFQLPKLLWLRDNEPEAYARVRQVLLPKDYIRYRLTGKYATEVSDASGTGAFAVAQRTWSNEVLEKLDLDPAGFPECHESDEISGYWNNVPVVGGGGDQAAGAVGTGTVIPGLVSVSLGTSGVVFSAQDDATYDPEGATHTFCHANRSWHRMGVMLSCGGALRWFRDVFAPGSRYDEIAAMAASVEAEGVAFLPYLAGERCPWNRSDLTGAFVGLTLAHGRAHLARAVFEGITMGICDALDAVAPSARPDRLRVTGGGAKSPFWRQLIADMTGVPVVTLAVDEGPAYGAALLAGVGLRVWPDIVSATQAVVREVETTEPKQDLSSQLAGLRAKVREQIG
jgi:xylulokinase